MIVDSAHALDNVVLVRLLVRPQTFTTTHLAKNIALLLGVDESAAKKRAEASLARLKQRGLIWADTKLMLTEEGERLALAEIGYSGLPEHGRFGWREAKKILTGTRLGLAPAAALADGGKGALVASRFLVDKLSIRLPKNQAVTPDSIVRALARRAMGLGDEGPFKAEDVLRALLRETEGVAHKDTPNKPAPDKAVRSKPDPDKAVRNGSGADKPPSARKEEDLVAFAAKVKDVALGATEGTWLGHKVFIVQAWKDFARVHGPRDLPLERFKERLTAAVRAGLLTLGRADLIAVLPQDAVRLSETEDGRRTYHFVETEHLR